MDANRTLFIKLAITAIGTVIAAQIVGLSGSQSIGMSFLTTGIAFGIAKLVK